MNQVTNKTPYGLLSKEEQAQFCGEANYKGLYEAFHGAVWEVHQTSAFGGCYTYRLIIKADEWYYICLEVPAVVQGSFLRDAKIDAYKTLRPATAEEIEEAKPTLSLEDRVKAEYPDYEVVMLEWSCSEWCMSEGKRKGHPHGRAQSMKGFAGYVYYAHPFTIKPMPIMRDGERYIQPIAVLFTKDSK